MDNQSRSVALLSDGVRMLAECKTIEDIIDIRDLAEVSAHYAKVKGLGLEAMNYASEIKIRAEVKLGRVLQETVPKGRHKKSTGGSRLSPTVPELGLSYNESARSQTIAAIPDEVKEEYFAETKAKKEEITTKGLLRKARLQKRKDRNLDPRPIPPNKYRVIYADPPWKYNDSGVVNEGDGYGKAERHYPTMTIQELCDLPIKNMAHTDSVLFLWTTSPMLEDSFKVIRAWGFQYKASFVWDKVKHNYGHYNSVRHEFLLVCTRGSCVPDSDKLLDSVISIERSGVHSQKPHEFIDMIDALYTHGTKIELFSRNGGKDGWDTWGNE